jgi:hypothetical protein
VSYMRCPAVSAHALQRRRPAKRRYLLPEVAPPVSPDTASSSAAAAAAARSSSSSADGAAAGSSDDVILTPDQIRPAMRELGDSVTSAVRFEDDDEDDSEGLGAAEGLNPAGAAAAAAGSGVVGGSARVLSPAQRVLADREALLIEQHGSAAGLNPTSSSSSIGPSSQPHGGWVEMGAMGTGAAAAAGVGAGVGTAAAAAAVPLNQQRRLHSPFGTSQAQQQQQHGQEALSPSSTAAAPAASSAAPPRRRPLSPFAVGYDMTQLAAAAPTLDSSSSPAGTQQLQP